MTNETNGLHRNIFLEMKQARFILYGHAFSICGIALILSSLLSNNGVLTYLQYIILVYGILNYIVGASMQLYVYLEITQTTTTSSSTPVSSVSDVLDPSLDPSSSSVLDVLDPSSVSDVLPVSSVSVPLDQVQVQVQVDTEGQ